MENEMTEAGEMPKYKCHKQVHALRIRAININPDGSASIIPEEDGYAQFDVTAEYYIKHQPKIGGYYVVYKDGHESFSPADAFESGYTPV